jgi:hypothetical protein
MISREIPCNSSGFGRRSSKLSRPAVGPAGAHDVNGESSEIFYDRIRRHAVIGGTSPAKFEKLGQAKAARAT